MLDLKQKGKIYMNGFVKDIETATKTNENFRRVLYTAKNLQLVLMSLLPGEDIGEEVHTLDQFLRIDQGQGKVVLDGQETEVTDGFAVIVPAGTKHNLINTGDVPMKLYTLYAPPEHKDGIIRPTKQEAVDHEEHFDGQLSE